jgi:hypothetical protein
MKEDLGLPDWAETICELSPANLHICRFSTAVYRLEAAANSFSNHPESAISLAVQAFLFLDKPFCINF